MHHADATLTLTVAARAGYGASLVTHLPALVVARNDAAIDAILAAYREAQGNSSRAARVLGVSRRTLLRWVARLNLRDAIDRLRQDYP